MSHFPGYCSWTPALSLVILLQNSMKKSTLYSDRSITAIPGDLDRGAGLSTPHQALLEELLAESAARHHHLCPRQVLGVRLGLKGLKCLNLLNNDASQRFSNHKKRLLTIVETDGCGADGVSVATDCSVGHRTLRVLDYGKVAATLIDTQTNRAIRVSPAPSIRKLARQIAPDSRSRWHAYLQAYQLLADDDLIQVQEVRLILSLEQILSKPGKRVICAQCGEEIFNGREIPNSRGNLCRSCAGDTYYQENH